MDEYTTTLLIFLFGAVCVVIGWSMGYGQASDKYKRRLGEQHDQIRDLSNELDRQIDTGYDIHMEMKQMESEASDWSNWK